MKCYDPDAAPSGLTAIGVVFDSENRLAIQAKKHENLVWWYTRTLVPNLETCDSSNAYDCAIDGKSNTKKIVDYYGDASDYAAGYCYNYTTEGTKKGDWFLPSVKEAVILSNNKDPVNKTLNYSKMVNYQYYEIVAWLMTSLQSGNTHYVALDTSDNSLVFDFKDNAVSGTLCVINY